MTTLAHFTRCTTAFVRRLACSMAIVPVAFGIGAASAQSADEAPRASFVQVQTGDTFSSIAARVTGAPSDWRKLYRPELSRLANPNRILVGMRFDLITDATGSKYLRLASGGPIVTSAASKGNANAADRAAPMTAAAVATTTPPTAISPSAASAASDAVSAKAAGIASKPLVIGVLPNISATILGTNYQRMTRYLERNNDQKVTVVIPANFKEFFDATMRGDYDVAIAAPHIARVAQTDRAMVPLLTYQPLINALFVAPTESTVKGPLDVRDRVVAFANPQSLVAMYGQQWLKRAGLGEKDYEIRAARTDLGVGRMLLSGDAVAAIMSNGEFRSLPADELARLKVIDIFAKIPNFIFMAHPRLEATRMNRLKTQLMGFFADPTEGLPFAEATGFTGLVDVDAQTLRELEAFAPATRKSMDFNK